VLAEHNIRDDRNNVNAYACTDEIEVDQVIPFALGRIVAEHPLALSLICATIRSARHRREQSCGPTELTRFMAR